MHMHIKSKIVAALALAVFVAFGVSSVHAATTADIQAQIQALLAQIQALQAQLPTQQSNSTSTAWCYTFNTNLSIGMSETDVTDLQTALQKDGESVTATGTFDDQTASAVTAFQEKYASIILTPYGLSNGTGYVGKTTRAELNSLFGCNRSISLPTSTRVCPAWGCNGPEPIVPIRIAPTSTSQGLGVLTVAQDSSNPPAEQVVMGSTGNVLGIYRFTETTGAEAVKLTDLSLMDAASASTGAPNASFSNIQLYNGSTLLGTATLTGTSNNGFDYNYAIHFSTPVIIPAGNAIVLTLKGDVLSYQSGGATDLSAHVFDITGGTAVGATSNESISLTVPACSMTSSANACPSGNSIAIYRTNITVVGVSATSDGTRLPSTADNIGSLTFTANTAGSAILDKVVVTFSGTEVPLLSNGVALYDSATGLAINGQLAYNGNVPSETMTFSPNATISAGTSKTYNVRINSSAFTSGGTLYATINDISDVTFTDGVDSQATPNLFLPTSAVPITINSMMYGSGSGSSVPTVTISANPTAITGGQSFVLTWSSTGATNCAVAAGHGYNDNGAWSQSDLPSASSTQIYPYPSSATSYTAQYQMTCTGSGGTSAPASASVTVTPPAGGVPTISIANISGVQASYQPNQAISFALSGTQSNGQPVSDSNGFNVQTYVGVPGATSYLNGVNGSYSSATGLWQVTIPAPSTAGTYNLSVVLYCGTTNGVCSGQYQNFGPSSEAIKNVTFTVSSSAASVPTVTISANPTTVASGQSATLSWSSTNTTACTASGSWSGSQALSGSTPVTPVSGSANVYTITCTGAGGASSASATVTVATTITKFPVACPMVIPYCPYGYQSITNSNGCVTRVCNSAPSIPAPTVTLSANPTTITVGQSTTLSWSSTNATACTASGSWLGSEALNGSTPEIPASAGTATYGITCIGAGGTSSASTTVTVNPSTITRLPIACPMFRLFCPYGGYSVIGSNGCSEMICNPAPSSTTSSLSPTTSDQTAIIAQSFQSILKGMSNLLKSL